VNFSKIKFWVTTSSGAWRRGEPNGGTNENCAIVRTDADGQLDDNSCETVFRATACSITPFVALRLRGLGGLSNSAVPAIDSQYMFVVNRTCPGKSYFWGFVDTDILSSDNQNSSWKV
jgi:hypothetical protein